MPSSTDRPRRTGRLAGAAPVRPAARAGTVACAVLALLGTLFCAGSAAHGGEITFTIAGDGHGRVEVTAVWADRDPVTEGMFGELWAKRDDGSVLGPLTLFPVEGRDGVYTPGKRLPAGRWQAVAVSRVPPGRGEATLTVTPTAEASGSAEEGASGRGGGVPVLALAGAAALLLTCCGILLAVRRRRSPASPSATGAPEPADAEEPGAADGPDAADAASHAATTTTTT